MFVASIDKNEGDYYSARRIIIMYRCNQDVRRNKAQVVKLVDTLASGASALTGVEVQVLSWAPFHLRQLDLMLRPSYRHNGVTAFHSLSKSVPESYLQLFSYYLQQH